MSNLIDELRTAREALRKSEAEASAAGLTLKLCREERDKARRKLDQLLDELMTGESRYPMFDRFRPNGEALRFEADEHQRGPTEGPAIADAKTRRASKRAAAEADQAAEPVAPV